MWMSAEDARSDFILTAAAMVFGSMVVAFLISLPLYPGFLIRWSVPVWVAVLGILPARALSKYRDQGLSSYGLPTERNGLGDGLLISVPLLVAGYVHGFVRSNPIGGLWGRLRDFALTPTVSEMTLSGTAYSLLLTTVVIVATVLTFGTLVARARDGFRPVDIPLLEGLRTFGLGAVAAGFVFGLVVTVSMSRSLFTLVLDSGALVVTILIVDRLVAANDRTTRATMLAPAITATVAWVILMGGAFSQGFFFGMYRGAFAAALSIVVAVLLETRRSAWAAVPLIAVSVWAPTCAVLPVGLLTSTGAPAC